MSILHYLFLVLLLCGRVQSFRLPRCAINPHRTTFTNYGHSDNHSLNDLPSSNASPFSNNDNKDLKEEFEHLSNQCCGEVNETDELEQLERDFFEIYQKMKKYNKKRIIQTTRDLYKLFKK